MNSPGSNVYTHSGKLGSAPFIVPAVALVAALVLGVAYAYVDVYSPIAGYVSILFVLGFAFGLGLTISVVGHRTHCRNTKFLAATGAIAGLVGLYTSWAAFEYALLRRHAEGFEASLVDVFLSPGGVWQVLTEINANGWYSIKGFTPTGGVLWAFWGIEAILVVGGTALLSTSAITGEVYCERCSGWASKHVGKVRLAVPEDGSRLEALSSENLDVLRALETVIEEVNPHLRLDSWECPSCRDNPALQIKIQSMVTDKKGKMEEKTEDLTPIFTVPASTFEQVVQLAARPALTGSTPG